MAIRPLERHQQAGDFRLTPLTALVAAEVAGWARSTGEAFWLAPRTSPPISGEKILSWASPGRQQLVMRSADGLSALGYGELNLLRIETAEYWLGHLIVDPLRRGQGLGTALTRLLLQRAFRSLAARRVSLVVFPENRAAVRCYERAGFRREGHETHHFPAYMRRARLLRMAIEA